MRIRTVAKSIGCVKTSHGFVKMRPGYVPMRLRCEKTSRRYVAETIRFLAKSIGKMKMHSGNAKLRLGYGRSDAPFALNAVSSSFRFADTRQLKGNYVTLRRY